MDSKRCVVCGENLILMGFYGKENMIGNRMFQISEVRESDFGEVLVCDGMKQERTYKCPHCNILYSWED